MGLSSGFVSDEAPVSSVSAATLEFGGPEAAVRFSGCVLGDGNDGGCANSIGFVCSAGVGGGACRGNPDGNGTHATGTSLATGIPPGPGVPGAGRPLAGLVGMPAVPGGWLLGLGALLVGVALGLGVLWVRLPLGLGAPPMGMPLGLGVL